MFRLDRTTKRIFISSAACYLVAVAVLLVSVAFAGSSSSMSRSKVSRLPTAPFSIDAGLTSVWTGKELIVSGQTGAAPDRSLLNAVDVAAAYNPATKTWRRLADPPKTENYCRRSAVWTGEEMLVWGCSQLAYNPQTDTWRRLPPAPTRHGIAVWTGKELIGWGGGCCGDADAGGSAYNPATNTWRTFASSPLAASQDPAGAWTGRELVLLVSGRDPEGKPVAGAARAAAYNPEADTWHVIAPAPASVRPTSAAWNGRELIVLAAERGMSVALAYDPAANRWRRLETIGQDAGQGRVLAAGRTVLFLNRSLELVYFPTEDRWQPLPRRRLGRRLDSAAVWTGQQLIVFDGARAVALTPPRHAPPELPQCCGGG